MKIVSRCIAAFLLPLLLASCGLFASMGNSQALAQTYYRFIFTMNTYDCAMAISPDGELRVRETTTTDLNKVNEATAHLTDDQRAQLIAAFRDWNSLKHQYNVDITGRVIKIQYNGYEVTAGGGRDTPASFLNAQLTLQTIVNSVLHPAVNATTNP